MPFAGREPKGPEAELRSVGLGRQNVRVLLAGAAGAPHETHRPASIARDDRAPARAASATEARQLAAFDPLKVGREPEPVGQEYRPRGASRGQAGLELEAADRMPLLCVRIAGRARGIEHSKDVAEPLVAHELRVARAIVHLRSGVPAREPVDVGDIAAPDLFEARPTR